MTHPSFKRCQKCAEEIHATRDGIEIDHDPICPDAAVVSFRVDQWTHPEEGKTASIDYTLTVRRYNGSSEERGKCLIGEAITVTKEQLAGVAFAIGRGPIFHDFMPPYHNHCWNEDGTCYGAYGSGPNGKCPEIHEGIKQGGRKRYYSQNSIPNPGLDEALNSGDGTYRP